MKRKYSIAILLVVAFVSGILFTTAGANWFGLGDRIGSRSDASTRSLSENVLPPAPASTVPAPLMEFQNIFVSVAEHVNPMVVQIHSEKIIKRELSNPFKGSPFEQFFNAPGGGGAPLRTQALGSGVVIREDGYILTNNHVIADASDLTITMLDGEEYDAEVVGTDPASDLAVIRIDKTGLPAISMPETSGLRIGEWVLAFGSPLSEDLGNTVTAGIVSAIGRTSAQLTGLNAFASFIQTDAAINPGNSGGPLVNLNGDLVGLNSAIYSRSGGNQGIAFAIPVDVLRNVATQLIQNGAVERGFLGVGFDRISRSLAEALNVPAGSAQITSVTEDSPAEDAQLEVGDVITSVNGHELREFNELRTIIGNLLPGDSVDLEIVRDGKSFRKSITLGKRSEFLEIADDAAPSPGNESGSSLKQLGFSLSPLTDSDRRQLGIADSDIRGLVVQSIDVESEAYRDADLRNGDIITEVDRKPVTSVKEFKKVYEEIEPGTSFTIRGVHVQESQVRSFLTALRKPE